MRIEREALTAGKSLPIWLSKMTRRGNLPRLVIGNVSKSFRKPALTHGDAAAIWLITDGAHGHLASDRPGRKLLKKFSKKLLTVGYVLHIWLFTDGDGPQGQPRSRFINR